MRIVEIPETVAYERANDILTNVENYVAKGKKFNVEHPLWSAESVNDLYMYDFKDLLNRQANLVKKLNSWGIYSKLQEHI